MESFSPLCSLCGRVRYFYLACKDRNVYINITPFFVLPLKYSGSKMTFARHNWCWCWWWGCVETWLSLVCLSRQIKNVPSDSHKALIPRRHHVLVPAVSVLLSKMHRLTETQLNPCPYVCPSVHLCRSCTSLTRPGEKSSRRPLRKWYVFFFLQVTAGFTPPGFHFHQKQTAGVQIWFDVMVLP